MSEMKCIFSNMYLWDIAIQKTRVAPACDTAVLQDFEAYFTFEMFSSSVCVSRGLFRKSLLRQVQIARSMSIVSSTIEEGVAVRMSSR